MIHALELTVNQFISHLDPERQGAILVSQKAMLEYLREQWTSLEASSLQLRRDLHHAAQVQLEGGKVRVNADPDERFAARAVIYAVMKLADRLQARALGKPSLTAWHRANKSAAVRANEGIATRAKTALDRLPPEPSVQEKASNGLKRWKGGYSGAWGWVTAQDYYPRSSFTIMVTASSGEIARLILRVDQLEKLVQEVKDGTGRSRQHIAAIAAVINRGEMPRLQVSHPSAQHIGLRLLNAAHRLAKRFPKLTAPVCLDRVWSDSSSLEPRLPAIEVIPETLETGQTLHFDASSRDTGYARVVIDGEVVDRVRLWTVEEPKPEPDSSTNRVRGGKVERVSKPAGTRALQPGERRVIELETNILASAADVLEREKRESPVLAMLLAAWARLEGTCAMPLFLLRMVFEGLARLETLREIPAVTLFNSHGRERLLGIGTRLGEVWVRGDADEEVMAKVASRLAYRASPA
ncbi:MAG: hypothetical protein HC933_00290 [Pleurocapsa sp. SU_196_0]|nr:hypothetical protein [Pleurocapsa sp. SU_196_0]